MTFYSVRDLRSDSKSLWGNLSSGDEVVITNNGKPAAVTSSVISGRFNLCYDYRIPAQYQKFCTAISSISKYSFTDESDRKFLEVAHFCSAILITGNMKHNPEDPLIITVSDFYNNYI